MTRSTTGTVAVPGTLTAVRVGADGRRAYVTSYGKDIDPTTSRLTVIDTASNTVTATIPVPGADDVDVSRDGRRAYVVSRFADRGLHVVDLDTRAVVGFVPVPATPQRVRVTPDGRHLVAVAYHQILVVDTATGSVTATLPTGDAVAGLVVSNDGRFAVVVGETTGGGSGQEGGTLSVVDLPGATVRDVQAVPVSGAFDVAVTSDDRRAYVIGTDPGVNDCSTGRLLEVDVATRSSTVVRTFDHPGCHPEIAVAPNGAQATLLLGNLPASIEL